MDNGTNISEQQNSNAQNNAAQENSIIETDTKNNSAIAADTNNSTNKSNATNKEHWHINQVKRTGKQTLRKHYLVCMIACLIVSFVIYGPMSISENAAAGEETLAYISSSMPNTWVSDTIDSFLDGVEKVKKATSVGSDAKAGVISHAYSKLETAGSLHGLVLDVLNKNIIQGRIGSFAMGVLGLLLTALVYIFVGGILNVGAARIFFETHIGRNPRLSRLFFIYRAGKTKNVAKIVFFTSMYLILWAFTIIGFPIKYYSYRLVPYLVAENPDISRKEVFKLSTELMRGHKWKMFIFDLTFIPWLLLSAITFGIVKYLWLDPYYGASKVELYLAIRGREPELNFYPRRQLPEKLEEAVSHIGAKPSYSFLNLSIMFIIFSFVGWLYEGSIWLFKDGMLVNRGTLYGPWLPIYGIGFVGIVLIVNRFHDKPVKCFFLIIAICAPVEYIGAWILWKSRHLKYWDYSGYFLNIQGRICLESMLAFAILGLMAIYVLAPIVDSLLNRIPLKYRRILCIVLFAFFITDVIFAEIFPRSGAGITENL